MKFRQIMFLFFCIFIVTAGSTWVWAIGPGFHSSDEVLSIEHWNGESNPVIYDQDDFFDDPGFYYLCARESAGWADLKGVVYTRDLHGCPGGCTYPAWRPSRGNFEYGLNIKAKMSDCGMQLGDVHEYWGSQRQLDPPGSGVIAHTQLNPTEHVTEGVNFIIQEAHSATPANPLILFIGGQCTSAAVAYLADPSIVDKIHVLLTDQDPGWYNAVDKWAAYIVAKRMNCVHQGYIDCFPYGGGPWDPVHQLPVDRTRATMPDCEFSRWLCNDSWQFVTSGPEFGSFWDGWSLMYLMYHPTIISAKKRNITWDGSRTHFHDTDAPTYDMIEFVCARWYEPADEWFRVMGDNQVYNPVIPAAPEIETVTTVSDDEVHVTWTDHSDDPQEAGFVISRKPWMGEGEWHIVGTVGQGVTSYTDTDHLHGMVEYTYRVGAYVGSP